MKIYTKTGDKGETSLVSGRRISKAEALIESYGTVDELNAFVGDLAAKLSADDLQRDITAIQHTLFNIGSLLAQDNFEIDGYPTLEITDITYLEGRIDKMNVSLTKMTAFILPVGSEAIAKAHICRTVCRRAERRVIDAEMHTKVPQVVQYLNRLSDYFFVMARYLHFLEGVAEVTWDSGFREK